MMTKNKILLSLGIALMVAALTATTVGATGTSALILAGSTTLGPVMVNEQTPFNAAGTGATIATISQVSSGAGINDLNTFTVNGSTFTWNPSCDVAMSSRALKTTGSSGGTGDAESTLDVQTPVAVDAVIMIVNNNHTPADITQLTKQQIRGIYEGVYALSANSGDPASGAGSQNEYWDAGPVTVPSTGGTGGSGGILGDDGLYYDAGVSFPALPGYADYQAHGAGDADHVQIVLYARNMESGTRTFVGDTDVPFPSHGGCAFAQSTNESTSLTGTYPNATWYPLEQELINGEGGGQYDSSTFRESSADNMQSAINIATNAAIGYVGIGYDYNATTAPNIRDLKIVDDQNLSSGSWSTSTSPTPVDSTAYASTNINIYSYHYHLVRYLYLDVYAPTATNVTPATDPNHSNEEALINWMTTTDGTGQDTVVTSKELRLVPDEDIVTTDKTIDIYQLVQFGNDWGKTDPSKTGTTHLRSDVVRDGSVDIYSLVDLGNWWGVNLATFP